MFDETVTIGGVTIQFYKAELHKPGTLSRSGGCRQGGVDTCPEREYYSVTSEAYSVATCPKHLLGAIEHAQSALTGHPL